MPWVAEARGWLSEAACVFAKDARTEWRTRVAASATALFAVGSVLLIALALRQSKIGLDVDIARALYTTLLWVLLFYTASTGLGRAFVLEEERGTGLGLRLVARAGTVWAGKFALNLMLLLALACLVVPLLQAAVGAATIQTAAPQANLLLLAAVVFGGCVGMASTLTLTSALVAQASAKGGMLAVLSLPVLTPLLAATVHGTLAALGVGAKPGTIAAFDLGVGDLQVLTAFALISITSALMLFDYLWND